MLNSLCTIHGNLYLDNVYNHAMKKVKSMPTLSPTDFQIIQLIGMGAFGRVYLVKKTQTAFIPQAKGVEYFALKILSLDELKRKNKTKRFHQEYDIMLSLQHPYIIKFYGAFADERNYYILMEYCQYGDLYYWMKTEPQFRFREKIAIQISAEIVTAIEYIQYKGIVFRDLKPENVLIGKDGHIRLTDFDLSKRVTKQGAKLEYDRDKVLISTKWEEDHPNTSIVGTIAYLAPEVFKGKHGQSVDFYTLVFGFTPFETIKNDYESVREKVLNQKLTFPNDIKVSEACKDLIKRLLEKNPEKRLGSKFGAIEVKQHPWFKNYNWQIIYDTCLNLKDYDLRGKQCRKDQFEIMCKDLVGTKFILPKQTQILIPKYKKLYQMNSQPIEPKQIDLNAEFFGMQQFYGDNKGGQYTIQAIKKPDNRLGITELFSNKTKKPKVVDESDL